MRQVKGLPEADQRATLGLNGVDPIYTDLSAAIESLRKGDWLAIGGPLHILAGSPMGIIDLVEEIRARGCEVIDITSGKTTETGTGRYDMLAEALDEARREKRFGNVTKAARKGAEARWREHTRDRMSQADARKIWKDKEILSNTRALELMPGWTDRMARFAFGPSGRKSGPK